MIRATLSALAATALMACAAGQPTTTPTAKVTMTAAPTTADGFTQMFAAKNDMVWSGGDQSTSIKVGERIYWLFGDTMVSDGEAADGSYPPGSLMVSNRILMQQGDQLVNAMANGGLGVPDPPTRTAENQERYWPQAAVYTGGHLYVLAQRVIGSSSGAGFDLTGVELAKYTIGADGKLMFVGMRPTPATGVLQVAGPAGIQWAGDAIISGGFVYVYGYTLAANNPFVSHFSYVARVPVAEIESPAAWRYYRKTTGAWVTSVAQLDQDATNQPDAIVESQISSVRIIGGKVVIAHKPWNGWGSAVYAEIGCNPWGPFTQKHLFDSPAGTWEGRSYVTYGPMLHPEQTLSSGKTLVTVNRNGQDFWTDVLGNADLYKPQGFEVTLP